MVSVRVYLVITIAGFKGISLGFVNETIILSAVAEYEIVIANSAPRSPLPAIVSYLTRARRITVKYTKQRRSKVHVF